MNEMEKVFGDALRSSLSGKREKVVCAKVSNLLNEKVRKIVEDDERYQTLNDFVEEAVLDKVIEIEMKNGKQGEC